VLLRALAEICQSKVCGKAISFNPPESAREGLACWNRGLQ